MKYSKNQEIQNYTVSKKFSFEIVSCIEETIVANLKTVEAPHQKRSFQQFSEVQNLNNVNFQGCFVLAECQMLTQSNSASMTNSRTITL